jgi:hypothetical protein
MLRAAVLTVVLSLAGTPIATAACLVWCGSPCPPTELQRSASVSANQDSCDGLLVSPLSVREDGRRDHRTPSDDSPSIAGRSVNLDLLHRGDVFLVAREHAPPGYQKSLTVLRI